MITICRIELDDRQRRIIEAALHGKAGLASRKTVEQIAQDLFGAFLEEYRDMPDQLAQKEKPQKPCGWCGERSCVCPQDLDDL